MKIIRIFLFYSFSQFLVTLQQCDFKEYGTSKHLLLKHIKACIENDENGYALISGPVMKSLLKSHGASDDDLEMLESGKIHQQCPPDNQLLHRKLGAHRVLIDAETNKISTANTHAITQFPPDQIVSDKIRR